MVTDRPSNHPRGSRKPHHQHHPRKPEIHTKSMPLSNSNLALPPTSTTNKKTQTLIPCEIIYGLSLSLTKTSFLVLYLRLFGSRRSLRLSIWIALTIIWAWALSVILESFLLCGSFRYNWDPLDFESGGEEERRECVDRNAACVASGVVNIVTDVMVMVMPIPHILVLQLRVGRKVGLVCVFSVGLV